MQQLHVAGSVVLVVVVVDGGLTTARTSAAQAWTAACTEPPFAHPPAWARPVASLPSFLASQAASVPGRATSLAWHF